MSAENLHTYCLDLAQRAKHASAGLACVTGDQKQRWLRHSAELLRGRTRELCEANARDVAAAPDFGLSDAAVDRLRLTPARITAMAAGLDHVAGLKRGLKRG